MYNAGVEGMVSATTEDEIASTQYGFLPPVFRDMHIGRLVFAKAQARYKALHIEQFLLETKNKASNIYKQVK
jgi:hypothetical protein